MWSLVRGTPLLGGGFGCAGAYGHALPRGGLPPHRQPRVPLPPVLPIPSIQTEGWSVALGKGIQGAPSAGRDRYLSLSLAKIVAVLASLATPPPPIDTGRRRACDSTGVSGCSRWQAAINPGSGGWYGRGRPPRGPGGAEMGALARRGAGPPAAVGGRRPPGAGHTGQHTRHICFGLILF